MAAMHRGKCENGHGDCSLFARDPFHGQSFRYRDFIGERTIQRGGLSA
jgi:hypothetical protein